MDNKDEIKKSAGEEAPRPERKHAPSGDSHFSWKKTESEPVLEREPSAEDKNIERELFREIEMMQIDENLKKEAEQKANKIHFLGDDEKIKHLLEVAREKGVVFAVKVAKSMNEPYLLDTFHDLLAKEGLYKDFIKK